MWNNLSREGRSRRVSSRSSSDRESRNRAKTAHCEGVRAAWLRGIRANPRFALCLCYVLQYPRRVGLGARKPAMCCPNGCESHMDMPKWWCRHRLGTCTCRHKICHIALGFSGR